MNWFSFPLLCLLVHLQSFGPVTSRRTRHAKRRGDQISGPGFLPPASAKPKRACDVRLPSKCNCIRHSTSLSITCFQAELTQIPPLEIGSDQVKTFNLEQNNLSTIKIASFFGTKIERLILSNNTLSTLDFLAFWGLEFHLQTLDLSYNRFVQVPSSSLRLLRNLRWLSLKHNRIASLRDFDFGYLRTLEVLSLDFNPIATIAPHTFEGTTLSLLSLTSIDLQHGLESFPSGNLKNLGGLSLANNVLTEFPDRWFDGLHSLRFLSLGNTSLTKLPADVLAGVADTMETLELNHNRFKTIPRDILDKLPNLKTLELTHNRIRKLLPFSFNTSSKLENLDLSNNIIRKVSFRAFDGLDKIERIDLRDNQMITLDDRTLYWPDPTGREILLAGNPFLCNCLLTWIKREFKRKTDLAGMFTDAMDMLCERPHHLRDMSVVRVHIKDFTCEHAYYYYFVAEEEEQGMDDDDDDDYYDEYYNYDPANYEDEEEEDEEEGGWGNSNPPNKG